MKNSIHIVLFILSSLFLVTSCNQEKRKIEAVEKYERQQAKLAFIHCLTCKEIAITTAKDSLLFFNNELNNKDTKELKKDVLADLMEMRKVALNYLQEGDTLEAEKYIETTKQLQNVIAEINRFEYFIEKYEGVNPNKVLLKKVSCQLEYLPLHATDTIKTNKEYLFNNKNEIIAEN